jgi:hypothetical protein
VPDALVEPTPPELAALELETPLSPLPPMLVAPEVPLLLLLLLLVAPSLTSPSPSPVRDALPEQPESCTNAEPTAIHKPTRTIDFLHSKQLTIVEAPLENVNRRRDRDPCRGKDPPRSALAERICFASFFFRVVGQSLEGYVNGCGRLRGQARLSSWDRKPSRNLAVQPPIQGPFHE